LSTPLTVLGGYLGAGKTTLLNRLLNRSDLPPVGVLVNDFGAINIDADLIRNRSGTTLQLANGCVCCSIADDLGIALEDMRALQVDQVIIEASGVAQPAKIADYGHSAPGYRLSQVLTVVDAQGLPRLRRDRYVGTLVEAQMQQADLLLVTKLDLLDAIAGAAVLETLPGPAISASQGEGIAGPALEDLLLEPACGSASQGNVYSRKQGDQFAPAHPDYDSLSVDEPTTFRRKDVERLLDEISSSTLRLKGWFTDEQKQRWLVQMVGDRWSLEPDSRENQTPGCRLVMIAPSGRVDLKDVRARLLSRAVSRSQ
jgi:G3E family GTPase